MNTLLYQRNKNGWSGGYVEWTEGNTIYLSVVFSWQLQIAYQRAAWYKAQGFNIQAGGPAISLHPEALSELASTTGELNAIQYHNSQATFTTRGCIRHCSFCAVPKIEGELRELSNWEPKPIVCDNNLLASSRAHFDRVIDRLKLLSGIDFNQGLDARLLTKYHALRLVELDLHAIRLAWDNSRLETQFMKAFEILRAAGIPKRTIRVYVLIGYEDTPDDAQYRLETIRKLGATPNPMRYQPLNAQRRNDYVNPGWSQAELIRFMRYWSNLRYLGPVPFSEFR